MIPLKDLMPEVSQIREPIRVNRGVVIDRDLTDMQVTVDRLARERKERRDNDTLMSTLIYSVWRRK